MRVVKGVFITPAPLTDYETKSCSFYLCLEAEGYSGNSRSILCSASKSKSCNSFLCLLEKIFIYLRIYCCCASMQRLSSIPSILPAMFVLEKVTLLSISQSNLPASFGFQLLGAWLRAVPSGAVVALGAQEVSGSAHMCRLASMIWGALLYGNCPVPYIFWGSIFLDK